MLAKKGRALLHGPIISFYETTQFLKKYFDEEFNNKAIRKWELAFNQLTIIIDDRVPTIWPTYHLKFIIRPVRDLEYAPNPLFLGISRAGNDYTKIIIERDSG